MKPIDFYILNFAMQNNIANAATPSNDVQVGNEYDFEITGIKASIGGATDVTGPLLVELILSGGQRLQENPVDMFSFASTYGAFQEVANPGIVVPWVGAIIPSGTKVTANWTNSSGQTLDFQLLIIGRKIWKGNQF